MPEGVKQKIYEFLTKHKGEELTVEDIARGVGEERLSIVKAQLTRLAKEGKVVKTPEGKYKAL